MKWNYGIILCCSFMLHIAVYGQQKKVKFYASADTKQIMLGSYFTASFTLENATGTNFKPPLFSNFNRLSGQNTSTSASAINGEWTRSITYSYILQPKKIGKFTIGSAKIKVGGKTFASKPLTIEVIKPKNSSASTQEDLTEELGDKVFIRAEINTLEAFIGQQLVLDYKLYTSVGLDNYNILNESAYDGFFAKAIRRYPSQVIKEVVNGKQYNTKIIRRVALFPQQAGTFDIEPAQISVSLGTGRRFFFGNSFNAHELATNALSIEVKSLKNTPPDFSGGIGKYTTNAAIDKRQLSTDDALTLHLAISGTGDIKRIQAPALGLPDTFEVYEPRIIEDKSYEQDGVIIGKKTFEYLVLPKAAGKYILKPTFTYFDTDSMKFVGLKPNAFNIFVRQGNKGDQTHLNPSLDNNGDQIRGIKASTALVRNHRSLFGTTTFWSLLCFPFLLLGGVFIYKRIEEKRNGIDQVLLKQQRANKIAQKHLSEAHQHLKEQNPRSFYNGISRALLGYVCDKLKIPLSELTKNNVKEKLQSLNVSHQHINKFMQTIQTCEMALFAGKDNAEAMNETYQNALSSLSDIENEIGKG